MYGYSLSIHWDWHIVFSQHFHLKISHTDATYNLIMSEKKKNNQTNKNKNKLKSTPFKIPCKNILYVSYVTQQKQINNHTCVIINFPNNNSQI